MECTQEMQIKHSEALSRMGEQIKGLQLTVSDFSGIKDNLIALKMLNEREIEFNKQQVEANKQFEKTLIKINTNLDNLNRRVGDLEETDAQLEDKRLKVEEDDKMFRAERYKSKYILWGVIAAGVLSLLGILIPLFLNK